MINLQVKDKVINIEKCIDCPFMRRNLEGELYCYKSGKFLEKENVVKSVFPDECYFQGGKEVLLRRV